MTCFQYGEFCIYAARHGITLVTAPETYKANHLLSMSCPRLLHCSVPSVFLEGERFSAGVLRQAVEEVCDGQGKAFVKDYVKGRRDTPCILSQDMDDETLVAEVASLIADRDASYTGGIAIRRYEPVVGETRFMIVNGKIAAFGAHFSDSAAVLPAELENALNLDTAGAGSRFYTIDAAYAESDGRFLVVETGDGQVSECPEGAEEALIGALGKLL